MKNLLKSSKQLQAEQTVALTKQAIDLHKIVDIEREWAALDYLFQKEGDASSKVDAIAKYVDSIKSVETRALMKHGLLIYTKGIFDEVSSQPTNRFGYFSPEERAVLERSLSLMSGMESVQKSIKSVMPMYCKCGAVHTRKDSVVCPCGNTLYDDKESDTILNRGRKP